jgi:secreted trypsin-like serine protease
VVLTAAHCVEGFDTWEVTAPYAQSGPVRAHAKTAKIHPHHKPRTFENDLAVVILDDAIAIGREFPTLGRGDLHPIGTKLVVVGRAGQGVVSRTKLFQALVTLVQLSDNINLYGGNPQLCEEGDSGGPVFVLGKEQEIAAVVSGGIRPSRNNVATDVYIPIGRRNRGWILKQIPEEPHDIKKPATRYSKPVRTD